MRRRHEGVAAVRRPGTVGLGPELHEAAPVRVPGERELRVVVVVDVDRRGRRTARRCRESSVTFVVACQLPAGVFWATWEIGAVLAPSMSPLVTARFSAPPAAGDGAAAPRTVVQRPVLSAPSNSSDSRPAQPSGAGVARAHPGRLGSVSSDQL